MTVVIMGNSHIGAVDRSYDRLGPDFEPRIRMFTAWNGLREADAPLSIVRNNRVEFLSKEHPKHAATAERICGKPYIDVGGPGDTWGLAVGSHTTNYGGGKWIDVEPSAICLPGLQPMSAAALRASIEYRQRYIRDFLSRLKSTGLRLFVISSPYPRSDAPGLTKKWFRPETAIHVDRESRAVLRDWLSKQGIDLIEPPPECRTSEGFLKPEFRLLTHPNGLPDYGHGNGAYGALMLQRIIAYLKTGDQNADIGPLDSGLEPS